MSNEDNSGNGENPNRANCEKHGSLGNYSSEDDARRGETMHQVTAHPDTTSVTQQNKRNKGQGGKR